MEDYKWKFPHTRNPVWGFCVPYLFLILIYSGYAYLVSYMMETYIMYGRSCDRDNVVSLFVIFSSGLLIVMLSLTELLKESVKIKHLLSIINVYQSLLTKLSSMMAISQILDDPKLVTFSSQNLQPLQLYYHLVLLVYVSMLTLVGEICTVDSAKRAATPCIIGWVKLLLQSQIGNINLIKSKAAQEYTAMCFIEYTHETLCKANYQKLFRTIATGNIGDPIVNLMATVTKETQDMMNHIDTEPPGFISIAVRMFGFLYLATTPFMFWITQGEMTIVWSAVVFICFGSIIFYRYYIGDILASPTTWHLPPVITKIQNITENVDLFMQPKIAALQNSKRRSGSSGDSAYANDFVKLTSIYRQYMTRTIERSTF
jgi:hypothetical protein